ncbi:MAG TPA: hypothetical protein VFF06_09060 [Polyangia bacterium]|nr:hypothetical protein [Polyangia bacterium]
MLVLGAICCSACATAGPARVEECCTAEPAPVEEARVEEPPPPAPEPVDFASRVYGPSRCAEAATQLLPADPDRAWSELRRCVDAGHFTALRVLLSGAWDRELQTRSDAPELLARVVAMRGGDVDRDVPLLHERRIPLFSLSQVLARPEQFRGTLVIVRARLTPAGLLDETRLVGSTREVELAPTERWVTRAAGQRSESRAQIFTRQSMNLDVSTGHRALLPVSYPFVDPDDVVVVLARFDGLRDTDAWPVVRVLAHYRPSALLSY